MILDILILISSAMISSEGDMISIGEEIGIHSEILGENRRLSIGLPYGYDDSGIDYPLLIVLDCGTQTALAHALSTMEILDGKSQAPQMIVAGIDTGVSVRDYFPLPLESRPGSGRASDFLRFIVSEVIPYMEKEYRVASCRILYGASNAGMFTVYAMLEEGGSFEGFIAASPSLAWFPDYFAQRFSDYVPEDRTRLYLNWGSDDIQRIVLDATPELAGALSDAFSGGGSFAYEEIELGGHVPYESLHNGLRSVFSGWALPDAELFSGGLAGLRLHYENLSGEFGFPVSIPGGKFMTLGQKLFREGDAAGALEVFTAYRESLPGSSRAWFFSGEANRALEDHMAAAECYRTALEIDSGLTIARERLESLEGGDR